MERYIRLEGVADIGIKAFFKIITPRQEVFSILPLFCR